LYRAWNAIAKGADTHAATKQQSRSFTNAAAR